VFYDQQQIATAFADMADSISLQDNLNGTITVTMTTTTGSGADASVDTVTYLLMPDYHVLSPISVPIEHRGDAWWNGDDGLIYIRYDNGAAQGFSIR
jgi:hypothetical protein